MLNSLQSTQEDINTERETFQTSRAGLDELYEQTNKQLKDETQLRLVRNIVHCTFIA